MIRIHVFLIVKQDVIGGDKDFGKNRSFPYQHTGKRKSSEKFVSRPYLLTGKPKIFRKFFFSPYHHTGPHRER